MNLQYTVLCYTDDCSSISMTARMSGRL